MEIKMITLILMLILSVGVSALSDCRDIPEVKVLNHFLEHKYRYEGGKPILSSETKIKRPLVRHWSNVSSQLFEIFYEFENQKYKVNSVDIKYSFNKKEIYNKSYKMKSLKKNLLQIDKYTFSDGVLKPEFRPGKQVYTFKSDDKPICEIEVSHFFGTEY